MRILLIEDEFRVAQSIARGLRDNSYAVDLANDGEEGLYLVSVNEYDAIILDIRLPRRDGFEVCRELRRKGFSIPVLMLTARDAVEDRIQGLDLGADDYLTKPFDFGELLARLRAILRRSPQMAGTVLRVGDLTLDPRDQTARIDEREILLTNKEFALINYLARNTERIVGRAEIAEHVWDDNFDPFSNVIETYITRLRRKIEGAGGKVKLQTKRNVGYRLTAGEAAD